VGVVARVFDEIPRVEAFGLVRFLNRTNHLDFDLRAVALVLAVNGPNLVELARLPLLLARVVKRPVGPGHVGHGALGVAESTRVEGLAVARRTLVLFREQREKISQRAGGRFAQSNRLWFSPRHRPFPDCDYECPPNTSSQPIPECNQKAIGRSWR